MPRLLVSAGSLAFALSSVATAHAQTTVPAHLSVTEGTVTIDRESGPETGVQDLPLVAGDRVRTAQGRAEILLGDGSAMHLDAQTALDVNGASLVRLLGGRLVVFAEPDAVGALQIDASPASIRLVTSGESRISLFDGGAGLLLDVAVVRGSIEVATDGGTSLVQAGQRVQVLEGSAPSEPVAFNSAQMDEFYRWSAALLDQRRGAASASYLPNELVSYASAFDESGSWNYLAPYGYVWYPTVAAGWRPYYHGRWAHVGGGVGWSFLGNCRWAWPTHHYGRWGMSSGGGWFWIPGSTWSSAWVQWGVSPGFVSWCPLGWNDRPVVAWSDKGGVAVPYGRHGGPWRAWSAVSTSTFARGGSVSRAPIDPRVLRGPSAPPFVFQRAAPNVAVPRAAIAPGGLAVSGVRSVPSSRDRVGVGRDRARGGSYAPPTTSSGTFTSSGNVTVQPSRGYRAAAPTAPPVIYYRGSPIPPEVQRRPPGAYDRAGIAVPRGLPADAGAQPRAGDWRGGFPVPGTAGRPSATSVPQTTAPAPTGGGVMRTAPPAPAAPPAVAPPARSAPPAAAPHGPSQGVPAPNGGSGPKH